MCSFHRTEWLWSTVEKRTSNRTLWLHRFFTFIEFKIQMPSLLLESPQSYRRIQIEKKKSMAKGATVSWLSDQLSRGSFLLLLDCRPFSEFARSHIQGAINLTIPSLMLRRLKKGMNFAISSLITSEEGKAQFNRNLRNASGIVLYDSNTTEVSSVCCGSALGVLLKKFSEDVSAPVWLLEGTLDKIFSYLWNNR